MISLRTTLTSLALLACSSFGAFAADLGSMPDDEPMIGSARFYLRGDLSYDWNMAPSLASEGTDFTGVSMGRSWGIGGGIGMYLAPNWRGDLTAEHHTGAKIDGQIANSVFTGEQNFNVSSDVFLANVYYDFGGRLGFNPYLGAGIGWAVNHASSGTATDACGCTTTITGATENSFAWALMAGASHELSRGISLDIGYRFLDVGSAHAGNVFNASGHAFDGSSPSADKLMSNEVRVGIRYDIQ